MADLLRIKQGIFLMKIQIKESVIIFSIIFNFLTNFSVSLNSNFVFYIFNCLQSSAFLKVAQASSASKQSPCRPMVQRI